MLRPAATLHYLSQFPHLNDPDALSRTHDPPLGSPADANGGAAGGSGATGPFSGLMLRASRAAAFSALKPPTAFRDLMGGWMGEGRRKGKGAELVRRQYARAAAKSMAEVGVCLRVGFVRGWVGSVKGVLLSLR